MKLKTQKSLPRKFFADLHSRREKSLTEETWESSERGDLGLDRIAEMDLEKGGERWPIQTEQPTLPKAQTPPRFRIQGRQNTGKPHFLVDSRSFGVVLQDRTQDKAGINLQGKTAPAHVNGPS